MPDKVHIAIVDDHQSIVDGYVFRISKFPQINIVATVEFGDEIEPLFIHHQIDVLLLDVNVNNSQSDSNNFPIFHIIPKLLNQYPKLKILVISMHNDRSIIRGVMEGGASGYILKDEQRVISELGNVILDIANEKIFLSPKVKLLIKSKSRENLNELTQRQLETISLIASRPEITISELADKLHVSNSTIRTLLSASYIRLGVNNRTDALTNARQLGLIPPNSPTLPMLQDSSSRELMLNRTTQKSFFLNLINLFRHNILWLVLFLLIITFYVLLKVLQS